jgi:hypothetical protein
MWHWRVSGSGGVGVRSLFAAALLAFIGGLYVGYLQRPAKIDVVEEYFSDVSTIESCAEQVFSSDVSQKVSLGEATVLCYERIRAQGLLNDFFLRRLGYLQQKFCGQCGAMDGVGVDSFRRTIGSFAARSLV